MDKSLRIRKVDIYALIQTLNELYDRGINYVDIVGEKNNGQDEVGLIFCKSYMDKEYENNFDVFDDEPAPSKIDIKLSDEDLDQLI